MKKATARLPDPDTLPPEKVPGAPEPFPYDVICRKKRPKKKAKNGKDKR